MYIYTYIYMYIYIYIYIYAVLKIEKLKILVVLIWTIDRYGTDPGGHATYHDGLKIAFSLWPKGIRNELGLGLQDYTY